MSGSNPTPFLGGTLVPVPILTTLLLSTNAAGEININVPGGGGPATVYMQFVVADPGQALGAAISNALKVVVAASRPDLLIRTRDLCGRGSASLQRPTIHLTRHAQ